MPLTLLILLAIALVTPQFAGAQILYGSIAGNVLDSSGAALADARIVATNTGTNQSRSTLSNAFGGYTFNNLEVGTYTVAVTAPGFQSFQTTNVVVSASSSVRVDAALQIGAVTEQVTVVASAATLQTDRSDVRFELESQKLQDLPTPIGRNFQASLRLLPGFTVSGGGAIRGSNPAASLSINVNGAPAEVNNTRIDGATAANNFNQWAAAYVPGLEAIETVQAVTSSYDAELGLVGGAAINVQIKSGSNQLHGSLFEYHSDNQTKARPALFPAAQNKPKMIFNQLGGTIGGPIKRDKLFYFLSYDGMLSRQSYSRFGTVPTGLVKTGDLSESPTPIYDPNTGSPDGSGRTPFPNNMIPSSRISPVSQKIVPLWPEPNLPGVANNYFAAASAPYNRHTVDVKLNYNATSKLTMFGRLGYLDWNSYYEPIFGTRLGGLAISGQQAGPADGNTINLTYAATYVITPSLIIDGYFGFNRSYQNVLPVELDKKIGTEFLGIPGTNGSRFFEGGWPRITISDFDGVGVDQPYMPWIRHDPGYNYVLNFNHTRGRHNIRFGGEFARRNLNHSQPEIEGQIGGASGGFVFTQGITQVRNGAAGNRYNSFGSFLLGLPQQMGRTLQIPDEMQLRDNFYGAYIQDRWTVTRQLTLSFGIRWEFLPMPNRPDRGVEFYDPATNTQLLCGYGSVPRNCGVSVMKDGFSPHVGLAYRPTSTLVVRAGFGLMRDPWDLGPRGLRTNYPLMTAMNYQGASSFVPAGNWAQGIPLISQPDYGDGIIPVPATAVVHAIPKDINRGYIASRNFTIEKQFSRGLVAQAGYVGTLVIRQFGTIDLNAGQVPGEGIAGQPLYARFGRTATTPQYRPLGTTNYNALQATVRQRMSNGLNFAASYTWSKTIGNNSCIECTPAVQALPYFDRNHAVLNHDRTHVLNVSGIWELPFGRGKRWVQSGVGSKLLGGWQTNGIFTSMTGLPFSVTASGTSLNMPGSTQFADQISSEVRKVGETGPGALWFDPTAYAPVTDVRFGTSSRNALRGPGLVNLDFGLFRDFAFTERFHLQFRGEAFNFTNTPHWGLPAANISAVTFNADRTIRSLGGFGSITSTDGGSLTRAGMDERTFRLGLRLSF